MSRRTTIVATVTLCCATCATAQPVAPPGFRVELHAHVDHPTAMAWGPGGSFGDELYVATRAGDILRIEGGSAVPFATGLDYPNGIAFATSPAFGELLYVCEYLTGWIRTVDDAAAVADFVEVAGVSVNMVDLAFGPGTGGFTTDLYVTDAATSGSVAGKIYRVNEAGDVTLLFGTDPFTAHSMAFVSGGGFGDALIVTDALGHTIDDGGVRSFDAAGGFTTIISATVSDLYDASGVAVGLGGAFGTDLFVSDFHDGMIYTLTAAGDLTDFASGFCFAGTFRGDTDLLFAPDGSFLLVADAAANAIWRIEPGDPIARCRADCDETGALDFFDFLCFQNQFAQGHPFADCDYSCDLDFFDFLCFQNLFAAGCP